MSAKPRRSARPPAPEPAAPPGPRQVPLDALINPQELLRFGEAVAELTQMECSALLYDPRRPRPVAEGAPIQWVRSAICQRMSQVPSGDTCQCLLDLHAAAHRAMAEGAPVTAGCIAGDEMLFACPIVLEHEGRSYPKAAIVAAAQDIFHLHFADRLAQLAGRPVVEVQEMTCQADKRSLNAAQLRLLRAIIEGQARSFSRQISDRYAQLRHVATIVAQKGELTDAYERLDAECQAVGRLQRALVPREPPAMPGFACATHYLPAQRAGGDYYDFLPGPDGSCAILVADVSGHGPGAAVVMAMMRAILHTYPGRMLPPADVLQYLNWNLCRSIMHDQFATAVFAVVESDGRLHAVSAGHDPPLLFQAESGQVRELEIEAGFPLGVVTNIRLETALLELKPGDVLLLYTDGIPDARDPAGEPLGMYRLSALLRRCAPSGAAAVRDALVGELRRLAAGAAPLDDQTLVVLERIAS